MGLWLRIRLLEFVRINSGTWSRDKTLVEAAEEVEQLLITELRPLCIVVPGELNYKEIK